MEKREREREREREKGVVILHDRPSRFHGRSKPLDEVRVTKSTESVEKRGGTEQI